MAPKKQRRSLNRPKYSVGQLVLTYKTNDEIPVIGMIIEALFIAYRVEWYSPVFGCITVCGEGAIKSYREAYKEYIAEQFNV